MRKLRDYDAELRALESKTRDLRAKRIQQLGELVTACGAGDMDAETLAGILLEGAGNSDKAIREGWRRRGAAFFQGSGTQGNAHRGSGKVARGSAAAAGAALQDPAEQGAP
ncbi:conjugal transfer protein TraD [Sphingobium boeckii]|uniref:Conjugal transfer protein TraD n=1 Tax=Sphingobium boeckii TaxID=1082345 RepID=A0A7W9ALM8_9SPHN|nr:conjugal transfer protein TraD [Sphingobium boeckii]MBB5687808.1 hypothetical protein [Sphingobium boeckii]